MAGHDSSSLRAQSGGAQAHRFISVRQSPLHLCRREIAFRTNENGRTMSTLHTLLQSIFIVRSLIALDAMRDELIAVDMQVGHFREGIQLRETGLE